MAEIRIENFGGRIPRMSSRLLPPNMGQKASDTKLFSGELRGWNAPKLLIELSGTVNTAYRIPNTPSDIWFTSQYSNVHVQKGTLVNDGFDRYYWTSGTDDVARYNTKARIAAASAAYILGAPAPDAAPTMTPPTGGSSELIVTRVFVYTFVSQYGEESAPSPPLTVTGRVDDTWTIASLQTESATPITGRSNFTNANGATKRIYRTITSASGQTNFFYIKTVTMATTSVDVSDTDETVAFNDLMESTGWNEPPDDLEGLITHPNGFLVGFVGTDLYFSEPYRPHAWPAKYVLSTDHEIMGLGIVGNTIGIATKSNPYACTGVHPAAMSLTKSSTVEPCLSKKGVVTLPNGVYYPSNNGLAWLNPVGATVITQPLMTKEEWQNDFSPDTLNACRDGVRYLAFEDATQGFIYDPKESRAAVVDVTRPNLEDIWTDENSGVVYILADNNVYEWDPSSTTQPITYTWCSKVFEFMTPVNLGAGIIKFNDGDFTIDPDFIAQLQTVNTTIMATVTAAKPLGAFNTFTFNGVRPAIFATYVTDLHVLGLYQNGTFNGSDLVVISLYEAQSPQTQVAVIADGTEVWRENVSNKTVFRLPAGFKAHTYQVEISGNTDVYSIALAQTGKGLMRV